MAMSEGSHSGNDAVPYINVTPLIDVLLVLLIIFMVISPQKPHQFEAKIPEKPPENMPDVPPDPLGAGGDAVGLRESLRRGDPVENRAGGA